MTEFTRGIEWYTCSRSAQGCKQEWADTEPAEVWEKTINTMETGVWKCDCCKTKGCFKHMAYIDHDLKLYMCDICHPKERIKCVCCNKWGLRTEFFHCDKCHGWACEEHSNSFEMSGEDFCMPCWQEEVPADPNDMIPHGENNNSDRELDVSYDLEPYEAALPPLIDPVDFTRSDNSEEDEDDYESTQEIALRSSSFISAP